MVSVLTLNLSRPPRERAARLLEYLWNRDEEVLVLTECAVGEGSALVESVCRAAGFAVASSLTGPDGRRLSGRSRSALGVIVVARGVAPGGLRRGDRPGPDGFAERVLSVDLVGPDGPLRLVGIYGAASDPVRYASAAQRQRKREWLFAFCTWVAALPPVPTVLVGDLNIVAPGHLANLPYVLVEERTAYDLLTGGLGYRDPLAGDPEPTWVDHSGAGCRYDFVLTGAPIPVGECAIDHTPRLTGLSDHAALSWSAPWPTGLVIPRRSSEG
ncbi:MAG: hypothetical protein U0Q21_13340 [Dermatophilaceae bacterium]